MYLARLSYSPRPSSTALTMVEKLSSVRIITAASLVTSVPVPIAIPMSAFFTAGASLTPSPVIATIWPGLLVAHGAELRAGDHGAVDAELAGEGGGGDRVV